VTLECPICHRLSPARSNLCECGFNFVTGELGAVIARATRERREASNIRTRGIATLAIVPLTASLGVVSVFISFWLTVLILVVVLPVQLLAGVTWTASGGMQSRRARRRLGSAASLRALPEARLIK
jgi:hypothetical protein